MSELIEIGLCCRPLNLNYHKIWMFIISFRSPGVLRDDLGTDGLSNRLKVGEMNMLGSSSKRQLRWSSLVVKIEG